MNQKYKRKDLEDRILHFCNTPKTSRELSTLTGTNYNTLRSKYIYHLLKINKIHRYLGKYKTIK